MRRIRGKRVGTRLAFVFMAFGCWQVNGADAQTEERLRKLTDQNERLQQQLTKQQEVIDSLNSKVTQLERKHLDEAGGSAEQNENLLQAPGAIVGKINSRTKVNLSGDVAVGFFKTGREGPFPNGEFRIDEARLYIDARAWENVYGYVELNIVTREDDEEDFRMGEVYMDLERLVSYRGLESLVNLRLGRFYIPFGEEYSVRYPMSNPLITHSLADLWGIDEGIELYGSHGPLQYALAVQNGGHPALRDFTSDKSIAGRLSYDPAKWVHLSVSGMRTGDLHAKDDFLSEMWFGNAFFRSLGASDTTTHFWADLYEGDVEFRFPWGHLKLAGGTVHYDDNDRSADNSRDVYYYSAEGLYRFTTKFYGAARYSQILAEEGFPVVGHGNWGDYFFRNLTDNLWRMSLGFGYQHNPNLLFKLEYSLERGKVVSGGRRNHEDFLGAQAALRF